MLIYRRLFIGLGGEVDGQLKDSRDLTWAFERIAFVKLRSSATVSSKSKVDHSLQLVPAKEASLSTVVPAINNGTSLAQELSRYAAMPFQHKEAWFRQQIAKIQVPWEDGHIKINVRRENLLQDSMEATESITQGDMRKIFRFEFISEPGTGGVIFSRGGWCIGPVISLMCRCRCGWCC